MSLFICCLIYGNPSSISSNSKAFHYIKPSEPKGPRRKSSSPFDFVERCHLNQLGKIHQFPSISPGPRPCWLGLVSFQGFLDHLQGLQRLDHADTTQIVGRNSLFREKDQISHLPWIHFLQCSGYSGLLTFTSLSLGTPAFSRKPFLYPLGICTWDSTLHCMFTFEWLCLSLSRHDTILNKQTKHQAFDPSSPMLLFSKFRFVRVEFCWTASARAWQETHDLRNTMKHTAHIIPQMFRQKQKNQQSVPWLINEKWHR